MSVDEIANTEDAKTRINAYFDTTTLEADEVKKLAEMMNLFSNPSKREEFITKLEAVSALIWVSFNKDTIKNFASRFTSAIIDVGQSKGFSSQQNVVFVGALDGAAFGELLRGGVLWKDSFALDHGEFSHSYQWLTAGVALDWKHGTAALYKKLPRLRSKVPLFVIDNGQLRYRRAPIWEYLVDCTNYYDGKAGDDKRAPAVEAYIHSQLTRLCDGQAIDPYFSENYLRSVYGDQFFQSDMKWKKEFDSPGKRAPKKEEIRNLIKQFKSQKTAEHLNFVKGEVSNFRKQNAITGNDTEGTFRSPNNVTFLVRRKSDWFINSYQLHRSGRRTGTVEENYPTQDGETAQKAAKLGKLGLRGQLGVAALQQVFARQSQVRTYGSDGKFEVDSLLDDGEVVVYKTQALTNKQMEAGAIVRGVPKLGRVTTPMPPALVVTGDRVEMYRTTNAIEGTRFAQHANYGSTKGLKEIANNVYSRSTEDKNASNKAQMPATFHNLPGTVPTSLTASIAIVK